MIPTLPLLLTLLSISLRSVECINVTFPEQPPQNATMNVVEDNFLGISYELASFDTLWGKTADAIPSSMQNYMRNINSRFTNPMRIRVGGNAMDGSTYVADMTDRMLNLTNPDAYFNDQPADFGPVLFDVMNGMADRAGNMQFIVGLSMRDPQNDGNVIELAQAAESKLGDRLDAMLLGNEPDLYAGHGNRDAYNISAYIPEIAGVLQDLKDQSLIQKPLIGGPTVCCQWSLDEILNAGLKDDGYKYYTLQHYPNNICNGANEKNTNITYYLSHTNVKDYVSFNQDGINFAKQMNTPVLLTEYNTVSCGGSNISNTFAATLWAIDAGLQSLAQNFSAVYIHTREYGVTYNLFDPPPSNDSLQPDWRTGTTYYSALFLSEVGSESGIVVTDLNLNNSLNNPGASVAAYGIWESGDNGALSRDKLVLLNFANGEGNGNENETYSQSFDIPANVNSSIQYRLLTASSVYEGSALSWAGQWMGQNGSFEGTQETHTLDCRNGCTIDVPSPGAALVIVGDNTEFYNEYEGTATAADATNAAGRVMRADVGVLLGTVAMMVLAAVV